MTRWELDDDGAYFSYDAVHGVGACEREKINTLEDLFGKEFSDKFMTRKYQLFVQIGIDGLQARIQELMDLESKALAFDEEPNLTEEGIATAVKVLQYSYDHHD